MRKGVASEDGGCLDQDAGTDGLVDVIENALGVVLAEPLHEVSIELAADHRGEGECAIGALGQTGKTPPNDFPNALGNLQEVYLVGMGPWHIGADRSDLDQVGDDFLDKEGIAFGFRADRRCYCGRDS